MPENEKKKILDAELDDDQLEKITGGIHEQPIEYDDPNKEPKDQNRCAEIAYRPKGDCACTVEDGSWCYRNDACISSAVDYIGCARAEAD